MFLVYKDENDKFLWCILTKEGREMVFSGEYEEIPGMWGEWVDVKDLSEVIVSLMEHFK